MTAPQEPRKRSPWEDPPSPRTVPVPLDALRFVLDETYDLHPACADSDCPWQQVRRAVEV